VRKATAPKQQTVVGSLKIESGHLVVMNDDKACLMNTCFCFGRRETGAWSPAFNHAITVFWQMTSAPSLSEANFFEAGVLWQLKHFKSHKATGPYGISPKRLKIASHAVSPHITSLFRWSIHIETVYESWKLARVSPIFKKDESINLVRSKQAAWIWNK